MKLIGWLLEGDVSIRYLTHKYLLDNESCELRKQIANSGYGATLLSLQKEGYFWGQHYYQPKWISTHYTLLELRRLEVEVHPQITKAIDYIIDNLKTRDGGIQSNPKAWDFSDVCMNGMNLFSFCFFGVEQHKIKSLIDFVLTQTLSDGGFNCYRNDPRYSVKHSSLHSTVSLVEGLNEYINQDYKYRLDEVIIARDRAVEFILMHQLNISDKTGEIINPKFNMISYPPRWKFDILRGLESLLNANVDYDKRMEYSLKVLLNKRRRDGTWPIQNRHPGQFHIEYDKCGKPSRINTLRALRVLKRYKPIEYNKLVENGVLMK